MIKNQKIVPDENGFDIFKKKINLSPLLLSLGNIQQESIQFKENVEVLCLPQEIPEFVLSASLDFARQFQDGVIIHISLGNNFYTSLLYSRMDLQGTPLEVLRQKDAVKSIVVRDIFHLLSICELLKSSLGNQKALILLENIDSILLAQKSSDGQVSKSSLLHSLLRSFQSLCQRNSVICLWVNRILPRLAGGLRETHIRDSLGTAWRQKISKLVYYKAP